MIKKLNTVNVIIGVLGVISILIWNERIFEWIGKSNVNVVIWVFGFIFYMGVSAILIKLENKKYD